MKITYKFYLVIAILVLSFATANYISGSYGPGIVKRLRMNLRKKVKSFKRSVGRTLFGKKYGQESVIEQVGVGQETTIRKTPSEIAKEFNQQNNIGWIPWLKRKLGFDMRTEGEKQLATVLINNKETVANVYDPEHWQFQFTGSYLPANKTIHRLRLNQEKTVQNQEYTFEWYQTPLTDQDKVEYSVLETKKGALFAVAVEKSNETGKIINLFCLNIYPNEQNELQALPIASTLNLDHLHYLEDEKKRLADYNALLNFVQERLVIDKQILSFTGKKYSFIDKIIPNQSPLYPKEKTNKDTGKLLKENIERQNELKELIEKSSNAVFSDFNKTRIQEEIKKLEEIQLIKTLDSNDEFQNRFLKYNAYLKDPISRLRLEIEEDVSINQAKYRLQWYQAVKNPELTDAIIVVVVLKDQAGNIVEFLCLEINPRSWAQIDFKSHEFVTKEILAKFSPEITEGDYPLTKLEELKALINFTEAKAQELYQLPYLIDWSGTSGRKVEEPAKSLEEKHSERFSSKEDLSLLMAIDSNHNENQAELYQEFDDIVFKRNGNRVNTVRENGSTLLHLACIFNNIDIIDRLLKNGASHDIYDKNGQLPVHLATNNKVLDKLRAQFGDEIINIKNKNGETPLDVTEKYITGLSNAIEKHQQGFSSKINVQAHLIQIEKLTNYANYLKSIGAKHFFEL